ncbi:hypothetical protein B4U80_10043, partial [Leptotrombidium deliense]
FTHSHIVKSVCFSADGNYLLTSGTEKLLKIFDLNNFSLTPIIIPGHSAPLRQALFVNNDKWLVSISDDKTLRFWDRLSQIEFNKVEFQSAPQGIELSRDGTILTICSGSKVSFWDVSNVEKIKEVEIPTKVNSATLHPDKKVFATKLVSSSFRDLLLNVAITESFKGHFGPVHCVRFSPDGELYASGSEDGTLRLWQTTVGKTYGLWKCVNREETNTITDNCVNNES